MWNLSRWLMDGGHRVEIITRRAKGTLPSEELDGVRVWRPVFYPVYPAHVHLHGWHVQRLVRQLEPAMDIFHLHTPLPPPIQSSRPLLLTVHTPMLGEARAVRIQDLHSLLIRLQTPISVSIERRLLRRAGAVATVSSSVAAELEEYEPFSATVHVLGNGVDIDTFSPSPDVDADGPDYIVAAGRLDARKGYEDLIAAMGVVVQRFPHIKLRIAGEGPWRARFQAHIRRLGLSDTVELLGYVERQEMADLYRGALLFVHAAHYEGLPTVLLEAMACGKAPVSTAVSGALDVIEDGLNGLLVPVRSPKALGDALCRLLESPADRRAMGERARETVAERFSWQAVTRAYLAEYEALLSVSG